MGRGFDRLNRQVAVVSTSSTDGMGRGFDKQRPRGAYDETTGLTDGKSAGFNSWGLQGGSGGLPAVGESHDRE